MDIWYWISEYGKVFCAYLFLMFLWPSVVFRKHLRAKSKTYYFGFCVTVPIVIINTVVLTLGLLHGLQQWTVCLIFYGSFVLAFLKNILAFLKFVIRDKYVKKAALFLRFSHIKRIMVCDHLFWEYGILAAVILYGMAYFSYGSFQVHSYGYGDLYTHHRWIYGLVEGNIFQEGVYPAAMHCFIYCMHTLFGIKIHSILLFLQGIHVAVFLLSAYLLLKKIFHWRYTPVFVLMLFLTLDLCNADLIHSMFRLQLTMPMEFGLHTVCLSTLFLMEYLDKKQENLLLFAVSLSAAVMTHFHTALMVVFVCIPFAVFAWKKVFNKEHFRPLVVAVLCAGAVAAAPMVGALMQGIPINSSIDWAISAISGAESRSFREQYENVGGGKDVPEKADEEIGEKGQDILRNDISVITPIVDRLSEIYDKGYAALYGVGRGGWMLAITVAAVLLCWFSRRKEELKRVWDICAGYPPVILASVIYIIVYMAPMVGLPDLLPEGRFFAPGHMMLIAVMAMPVDIVFSLLIPLCGDLVLRVLSLLSVLGIYGIAVLTGNFRGFLFYELSRYNAAAEVTESIIETFPQYSYTIVSPTDELYPVIQYGWHEELLDFIENCNNGEYHIPSKYVFIYVEKRPLLYAQSHFFEGPLWMGDEKYLEPFWEMYSQKYGDSAASQAPDIIAAEISEEETDKELPEYKDAWSMYTKIENRAVLESKIYNWCRQFAEQNPSVLNIYYEDDDFVCYYFRQNAGKLPYELGVMEAEIYDFSGEK